MIKLFKDKSKCNDISLSIICTIWVPAGRDVFIETVDKRQLHADAHVLCAVHGYKITEFCVQFYVMAIFF